MCLEQCSKELPANVHAVMILNQAGFHTAKALKVPPNVTLIMLPPYSPELNPTENLWHYLRRHYWPNRSYDDYEDLLAAACQAWQEACLDPDLIKTICAAKHLIERSQLP